MRRMGRSDYLTKPRLDIIEADKNDKISTFKLNLVQIAPKVEQDSQDGI
jgi:hypothetical protein